MARASKGLVICVKNEGYSVSLERRKLYVALTDAQAAKHGQLRVIDESGEDYLYPKDLFVPMHFIVVPRPVFPAGPGMFTSASSAASSPAPP